jgi:hypothetical protein
VIAADNLDTLDASQLRAMVVRLKAEVLHKQALVDSVPARMSSGSTASQIASTRITEAARAARLRRHRLRPSATTLPRWWRPGATRCGLMTS